jgi:hypothetical protein
MAARGNEVEIVVKTKDQATGQSRRIVREVTTAGDKAGRGFSSRMHGSLRAGFGPIRGLVRGFGPTLVAAVGIGALTKAANDFIGEARDAAKVGRQTQAVIKSTGGAARVSGRDVEGLAGRLSKLVAVDDEVIQSGENILLTFTNIRNVGADRIFDKATFAAVDMAAALNQGEVTTSNLQKANIQLGKALQDPIKGVTALSRVGVNFTQQQKDQIKTMVEAGDVVGAQKLILAELTKEFGGSAAAAVDADKKFNVWAGNVKERLGAALLDLKDRALAGLMAFVDGTLLPGLKNAQTWFDNNRDSVKLLAQTLQSIFVPAAKNANRQTDGLRLSSMTLAGVLSVLLEGVLRLVLGWLQAEKFLAHLISGFASFITAGGHAINVVDRLSGGTGHAGDAMVAFGEDLKRSARQQLQEIQGDARRAQAAIDRMHGKTINIFSRFVTIGAPPGTSRHGIVGQHGGIVRRPTMALIGEAGPEAVVPLGRSPGNSPLPGRGLGGGGPLVLHISIGGRQLAQVLVDPLRKEIRSLGGDVQVALGSGR